MYWEYKKHNQKGEKEREKRKKWEKEKSIITEKKYQGPVKKMQVTKKRYYRDPESRKQYWKRNIRKILNKKSII